MINTQSNFALSNEPTADFETTDLSTAAQLTNFVDSKTVSLGNFPNQFFRSVNDANINGIDNTITSPVKLSATTTRPSVEIKSVPVELLAEWGGCVTEVNEDDFYFAANLLGIQGKGVKGEEEDAIIPISDVNKADKELLVPGNFFRLCVMYEIDSSGQPRRYTQVIFRRMPAYRQLDLDEALERGRKLARGLRVE